MRKYFFAAFFLSNSFAYAQQVNQPVKLVQYVFDDFKPGTVKLKSGQIYKQVLNYNIITREMVFDNNGKFTAIANVENIDAVGIGNRKFIPLNNKFYEVLVPGKMPLILDFTATVREPGTSIGYGSTTNTSAASSYQSLIRGGGAYQLKLPDGFTVIPKHDFFILKDAKLEKVANVKQLIKIFPDKKDLIKDFVEKNDTRFSNRNDMTDLIKQLEGD